MWIFLIVLLANYFLHLLLTSVNSSVYSQLGTYDVSDLTRAYFLRTNLLGMSKVDKTQLGAQIKFGKEHYYQDA